MNDFLTQKPTDLSMVNELIHKGSYAVFGHTGLIGEDLVRFLIANNAEVTTFGRAKKGRIAKHIDVDLSYEISEDISLESFSHIIYLAQARDFNEFPSGMKNIFFVNTLNPLRVAERCARSGAKFIYASTGSVYDLSRPEKLEDINENLSRNLNQYSFSKLQAEILIKSMTTNAIIVRPFTVFGKNARNESLIANLAKRIHLNEIVEVPENGQTFLTPTAVRTIVRAIIHLLTKDLNGIYNIAGNQTFTLEEVIDVIGKYTKRSPRIQRNPHLEARNLQGNINKLLSTGYDYFTTFDEAIREMLTD